MSRNTVSQTEEATESVARRACLGALLGLLVQGACAADHEPGDVGSDSEPGFDVDAGSARTTDVAPPPGIRANTGSTVATAAPTTPTANPSAAIDPTTTSILEAGVPTPPSSPPAAPPQSSGAAAPSVCRQLAPAAATCQFGAGATLPEDLTVDLLGTTRYFAGGSILPSGRYRIAYVDGCLNASYPGTTSLLGAGNWTVHPSAVDVAGIGTTAPDNACWLVGEGKVPVKIAPGTASVSAGARPRPIGVFDTYTECVAANCKQAPEEFFFGGGKLGLRFGTSLGVPLISGEPVGGRAPTFRITRVDPCP